MFRFPIKILIMLSVLAALSCLAGCRRAIEPEVIVIPEPSEQTALPTGGGYSAPTAAPTAAPSSEPTPTALPATNRDRLLAGQIVPVTGIIPESDETAPVFCDIDGDGKEERLSVEDIDGGPVFCISGEPFLDADQRVCLASLDGKNVFFLTEREGEEGFSVFYADYSGNLFCRFVGRMNNGSAAELERLSSWEEYVRAGLELPLQSPPLYEDNGAGKHTVRLDMDGDGAKETIEFDGVTLTLNGEDFSELMLSTLPRFIYDEDRSSIALYGSAGDVAVRLFIENGKVVKDVSYAQLL